MTCGVKKIGLWASVNRRLLMLTKDNYRMFAATITRNLSTTTSDSGNDSTTITPTNTDGSSSSSSINDKKKPHPIKDIPDEEIKKSVFVSQSHDIFTNLALEDWLYRNFDFSKHHVLMLWSNDPCVVIGRHQNPFSEANVSRLERNGIVLARRNSGGGTVYHDRGNINLTFFTPRERYDRKYNLNIITRALFREWEIKAEISVRDDITLHGNKISGTAAKLGQKNAYHHCTLLVNADKTRLKDALHKEDVKIESRATASVPSPVKNLIDVNRHVNVAQLQTAVGYEFLRTAATKLEDGGRDLVMLQRGFNLINPTDKWYPGLDELRNQYASWEWRLAKTPKFSVSKVIQLKGNDKYHDVQLKICVDAGIIVDIMLILLSSEQTIPVVSTYRGQPYTEDNLHCILNATKGICLDSIHNAIDHSL